MRRVHFTGPKGELCEARLVYDYGKSAKTVIDILLQLNHSLTVGENK